MRLALRALLTVAVVTSMAGCGNGTVGATTSSISVVTTAASFEIPPLTIEYPCGYGFYASDEAQSVGLFLFPVNSDAAANGSVPRTASLADGAWRAELRVGSDLFANWCDDVVEPNEAVPFVRRTWPIIAGTIEITELPLSGESGRATAKLRGLQVVTDEEATVDIPDLTITNDAWGMFAG